MPPYHITRTEPFIAEIRHLADVERDQRMVLAAAVDLQDMKTAVYDQLWGFTIGHKWKWLALLVFFVAISPPGPSLLLGVLTLFLLLAPLLAASYAWHIHEGRRRVDVDPQDGVYIWFCAADKFFMIMTSYEMLLVTYATLLTGAYGYHAIRAVYTSP